jgi:molybdate transport system substrate-binding protein
MRNPAALGSAFLCGLLALAGCSNDRSTSGRRVLRVAAAADLKFALDEVLSRFHERHPDVRVRVSYGSSGNFFRQLSEHAPFDLFFSADVDYPRQLIARGLARKDSEFLYAVGHLVVWVRRDSGIDVEKLGARALLEPSVRKIAIANPRHAPYGRAAKKALESLGLYARVRDRIVLGENVAQAAQFVQSGAADVGVIALSQALAPTLRQEGRFWEIPLKDYPRLEQGGVILSWAEDRPAAEALRAFVLGSEGKAILRRYGFTLPEK